MAHHVPPLTAPRRRGRSARAVNEPGGQQVGGRNGPARRASSRSSSRVLLLGEHAGGEHAPGLLGVAEPGRQHGGDGDVVLGTGHHVDRLSRLDRPGTTTARYAPGRPCATNRLTHPFSPIHAAKFAHGMRGPVTSRTTSPTRQRSPTRAPSTSRPSVVRFSPKMPSVSGLPSSSAPVVELLAGHRVDGLPRPAVVPARADLVAHHAAAQATLPGARVADLDPGGRALVDAGGPPLGADALPGRPDVDGPDECAHAPDGTGPGGPARDVRAIPRRRSGSVPGVSETPAPDRRPTAVDAVADDYFRAVVAASPMQATYLGLPEHQRELDDLSPAGYEHHAALARDALRRLDTAPPVDDIDRVTVAAMRERLGLALEEHEAGYDLMELNVLASPLQGVRGVFDLMPTASQDDWATIGARLAAVPAALEQWTTTLREAAGRGQVAPRRQVERCVAQCDDLVADDGYFTELLARARAGDDALDDAVAADLRVRRRGRRRRPTAGSARTWPPTCSTGPPSPTPRGSSATAWPPATSSAPPSTSRRPTPGARRRWPGSTPRWRRPRSGSAGARASRRPSRSSTPTPRTASRAPTRSGSGCRTAPTRPSPTSPTCTSTSRSRCAPSRACIAPTHTGGIYYTPPSDDFSRPGRMWWSVPKGVTRFGTWRELTTVYHEGVPGHHLQVGQTAARSELLNRWRRHLCWVSGHGEGWALYAEWLMADLGYMSEPGNYMGLLDGQSLRAARVVIDIGVHCGFEAPAEVGGGAWTYDKAWQYLDAHANQGEAQMRFELDRYLGWPGQAPSYKVGERIWIGLRDEVAAREGDAFSLKDFHRRALDVGSVGLDVLREALLGR